jgi:hypothetical protein
MLTWIRLTNCSQSWRHNRTLPSNGNNLISTTTWIIQIPLEKWCLGDRHNSRTPGTISTKLCTHINIYICIHINSICYIYIYIYIKIKVDVCSSITQIYTMYKIIIYTYVYIYMCVCVCVCMCMSGHNSGTPGAISTKLGTNIACKKLLYFLYIYIYIYIYRDIFNVIIVYISLLMMAKEGRNMWWQ